MRRFQLGSQSTTLDCRIRGPGFWAKGACGRGAWLSEDTRILIQPRRQRRTKPRQVARCRWGFLKAVSVPCQRVPGYGVNLPKGRKVTPVLMRQ